MNERNTFADTSIYGCGCVINNFELPRLAKRSSIIQLSNSKVKEWIFHSTCLNNEHMM